MNPCSDQLAPWASLWPYLRPDPLRYARHFTAASAGHRKISYPDQVVRSCCQCENCIDPFAATVMQFVQASDGLEPSEYLFNPFSDSQADLVSEMLLAFFIHQILELCDSGYQYCRSKFSSRQEYWDNLRAAIRIMLFVDYEHLFGRPTANQSSSKAALNKA
jgi:hypothetical protein